MAYPVGANVIAAVRGKIIRRFAGANAFNEGTAKTLAELNLENKHTLILNSFIRRGQIVRTNDDKYYLNYDYYVNLQRKKKIIIPICLILCLALIISMYFFAR